MLLEGEKKCALGEFHSGSPSRVQELVVREFPGVQWLRTGLPMQGTRVPSWLGKQGPM